MGLAYGALEYLFEKHVTGREGVVSGLGAGVGTSLVMAGACM